MALHLTPEEFAERLGLPLRRARRVLKPTRPPSLGLMARVLRSFPTVNSFWLLSGEGEVFYRTGEVGGNTIGINYGHSIQVINHACSCDQLHDQLRDKERTIQILLNLPSHPLHAAA